MRKFKTESKKLLDLMVNSIYTNKEIFLRELISNASDSLDKLYLRALTRGDKTISRKDLRIDIVLDPQTRTLTISDNGIGMTKDELDKNLGTIAHSGSLEAKEAKEAQKNKDVDIIGQFGVGFYSSFMVADKVEVLTRAYGSDEAFSWKSDGIEGYDVKPAERAERGTDVILHLRTDSEDGDYSRFLNSATVQMLVKRYSDYIRYPIHMEVEHTQAKPRPDDAGDDYKTEYETVKQDEVLNSMVPIWTRKKKDVSDEEYNEFYKTTFRDVNDPLRVISMHAEGAISYDVLLFIPSEPPMDLYSKDFKRGLALYSSNVLIMEQCEAMLPESFGFVRGIVDSPDFDLNISRETLQQSRQLTAIARKIEKKIKSELADMCENDRDTYVSFFNKFGHTLKYAIYSSFGARSELLRDLLLFYSAKKGEEITLAQYCEDMPEGQNAIYYATGDARTRLSASPSVKAALAAGNDVLLCTDTVDEFCFMTIHSYNDKELQNVADEAASFESKDEAEAAEKLNSENADLFSEMAQDLGEHVERVQAAKDLTEDVASAVRAAGPVSLSMEKYFSTLPDAVDTPRGQHVLEINCEHPIFQSLLKAYKDKDKDTVKNYAELLYDQALLAEGLELEDPAAFNVLVLDLLAK